MRRRVEDYLKRWFVNPSSGMHLDMADGMRGIAILLVMICHGIYANPDGSKTLIYLTRYTLSGWMGVPIFFVLSGFLISQSFFRAKERDLRFWYPHGYCTRRILKIVPPFYLVTVVLVFFYYWQKRDPIFFKAGLEWATGIAHFKTDPVEINGSFWSLWVELGFYVVLPILFFVFRGVRVKTAAWAMFFILLAGPILLRFLLLPSAVNNPPAVMLERRFPDYLDPFSWGVLFSFFFLTMSKEPARWRSYAWIGNLGIVAFLVTVALLSNFDLWAPVAHLSERSELELKHLLPAVASFLLMFLICDPGCLAARFFSLPALRFLGMVSYEVFLIHQPIQISLRQITGGSHGSLWQYILIFAGSFLISVALATLIYHNFSLPILKWGRNRLRKTAINPQ